MQMRTVRVLEGETMNKTIAATLSLFTLVSMIYTADAMYVRSKDFKAFAEGYAADKSEAKIDALTQRQWKIEDRIEVLKDDGSRSAPAVKALEEQMRDLQNQIDREKAKLNGIYEKK